MAKIALIIGISEYGSGLNSLPNALKDIEAMQQVLEVLESGGFDEVKCLANPNPPIMREAIEILFSHRQKNDLVLLFFSGYVVQDNQGKLYFSTSVTCKTSRTELIRVSTVPVTFVQELINNSECQQTVLILDCCLDEVSPKEITQNNEQVLNLQTELGGEGRVILSCFTSIQKFGEQEDLEINHSVYTSYLIEGMNTGVADLDNDGWIAVHELHQYASNQLKIAAPSLKPEYYSFKESSKILLIPVTIEDSKLQYRKEVENWINCGEISQIGNTHLEKLAASLGLSSEDCNLIKEAALKPYQEYKDKLQRYQKEYKTAIDNTKFLDAQKRNKLISIQQSLGIKNEDIVLIEEQAALKIEIVPQEENELDISQTELENATTSPDEPVLSSPIEATISVFTQDEQSVHDSLNQVNSKPLPPSIVVPDTPINPSQNLETTETNTNSNNKFIIPVGIGGILTTIAVVMSLFQRTPVTPPPVSAVRETTSEKPSNPSPIETPSPSPSAPESQTCTVFVNGNLRSEPTYLRNNVVEALREPLAVTGKQTKGGWIEVRMPNDKLAWAYQDIISDKARKEMNDCINQKKITITLIEDILPPDSNP